MRSTRRVLAGLATTAALVGGVAANAQPAHAIELVCGWNTGSHVHYMNCSGNRQMARMLVTRGVNAGKWANACILPNGGSWGFGLAVYHALPTQSVTESSCTNIGDPRYTDS